MLKDFIKILIITLRSKFKRNRHMPKHTLQSNSNNTFWTLYGGANTNFLAAGGSLGTTVTTNYVNASVCFKNNNSQTQQIYNIGGQQSSAWIGLASVNTSTNWNCWLNMCMNSAATLATNVQVGTIVIEEVVVP